MKEWFVVHTQPLKENFAAEQLRNQGFFVYLPKMNKIHRHARKTEIVSVPLFPRYLFIALDLEVDRWRCVNGTRGVVYLLTNNEKPIVVAQNIVLKLQQQENAQGIVPVQALALFHQGDMLHITEGAFQGQQGIFESMDDKMRVHLLLEFLGRETRIVVPFESVDKVE